MNNEAKVRRSTKLLILGKAKVMSYEDLNEARAKRAAAKDKATAAPAEEKATAGNGKHGRPRKTPALEATAPEASLPEVWMTEAPEMRMSEVPETRMTEP
ncbi:uncharacterized protein BDZ99DRAFT_548004 [Mytilinidion resinicola]|uniref:Uncharacterized protein n=1 Tax=Mytilinidion resinicola TaxID=574789 RepID=A0A6A6Y4Z2_9PEZI|nr:uncharacterized protein BDZ99DRAFT_548004 [Mytilinidion resinicola]KAF2802857.1 hypothetical protein BDZ99DRAFT_548004 [Mytilinidion resinicola]